MKRLKFLMTAFMLLIMTAAFSINLDRPPIDNDVGFNTDIAIKAVYIVNHSAIVVGYVNMPERLSHGDSFSTTILSETNLSYDEMAVENGSYNINYTYQFYNIMYISPAIVKVKKNIIKTGNKNIKLFTWRDPGWQKLNVTI